MPLTHDEIQMVNKIKQLLYIKINLKLKALLIHNSELV